jgi:hypothetical protein
MQIAVMELFLNWSSHLAISKQQVASCDNGNDIRVIFTSWLFLLQSIVTRILGDLRKLF